MSILAAVLLSSTGAADTTQDQAVQEDQARALQETFAGIAERLAPSVVSIAPYVRDEQDASTSESPSQVGGWVKPVTDDRYPGFLRIGASSGFVIDARNAIIVTARTPLLKPNGAFADAFDIETSDKLHSLAVIVGVEPTLDLAFLRIVVGVDGQMPAISQITWGDSSAMKPGYWAFAIGDPFGIEQFFAPAILSATPSRDCYQENLSASYLQTAISLHPEAFGGPLVDIDGNVIGLLAPREDSSVIGPARGDLQFALPSNIIKGIAESILEKDSFVSPWLGFSVMSRKELRDEIGPSAFSKLSRPEIGISVENVFDPSPAHAVGIRPGDFLVSFDGHPIHTPIEFQKYFYLAGVGSLVDVEIFRAGETIRKSMRIEERPPDASSR